MLALIKFKSIKTRLLVVFLTIGLLSVGVFGYLNVQGARRDLEKEVINKLELYAGAKEGQM